MILLAGGGEDVLPELVHEDVESLVYGDAPELLLGHDTPGGVVGVAARAQQGTD
jgi:hypothetical protein